MSPRRATRATSRPTRPATTLIGWKRTRSFRSNSGTRALRRRLRDGSLDHALGLRRAPIGWTDQSPDLFAVTVDDERGRHADRLQGGKQLARWVGVERKIRGAGLLQEGARLVRAVLVDIDRHHLEGIAAELGLKPV